MGVYGYYKRMIGDEGLCEMKQVTFDFPLSDLRKIAAFLIKCAEQAESHTWRNSHMHMDSVHDDWSEEHCDIVVMHPSPEPPRRVV